MSPEGINAEVEFFKAQICSSQADPKVPRTVQLTMRAEVVAQMAVHWTMEQELLGSNVHK